MRITFISFLLILGVNGFAQSINDTSLITQIVNRQMEIADKAFGRKYTLRKTSMPHDTTQDYLKTNDEYNQFLCGKNLDWSAFGIQSQFGNMETDKTKELDYNCFISTPIFNSKKTRCRLVMNTHYSEWGGHAGYYFYKRKGKKWKLIKSTLIWIS